MAASAASRAETVSSQAEAESPASTRVLSTYAMYVASYLGIALIGGGIVHLPMAPVRYGLIGAFGAALFVASSVAESRRRGSTTAGAKGGYYVALSIALAIGLGLLSGSIQHFADTPRYAATLIPVGILLSLGAWFLREGIKLPRQRLIGIAAGVFVACLALGLGLQLVAHQFPHEHAGSGHSH